MFARFFAPKYIKKRMKKIKINLAQNNSAPSGLGKQHHTGIKKNPESHGQTSKRRVH